MNPLRFLLILVFTGFFATAYASEKQAADYAMDVGDQALAIISGEGDDAQKKERLSELFVQHVDTDWIGRFVLGHNWRGMSEAQKQEYLQYYRGFLINQYTANFQEYAEGTHFTVTRSRPIGSKQDQFLVSMEIKRGKDQPVYVDYRVRGQNSGFRVIDIVVEGVSLLATQRSEFASVVQRKGIDHLIDKLKEHGG